MLTWNRQDFKFPKQTSTRLYFTKFSLHLPLVVHRDNITRYIGLKFYLNMSVLDFEGCVKYVLKYVVMCQSRFVSVFSDAGMQKCHAPGHHGY